jgi:hypothetical protein
MKLIDVSRLLGEVWNLYKKYGVRKLNDGELEKFSEESKVLFEKYKTPLAKDILLALVGEIERSAKFFEKVSR